MDENQLLDALLSESLDHLILTYKCASLIFQDNFEVWMGQSTTRIYAKHQKKIYIYIYINTCMSQYRPQENKQERNIYSSIQGQFSKLT